MGRKFTRRTFLKLSGATAAAFAVSGSVSRLVSEASTESQAGSSELVRSFCEMCTSRCPIQAKVENGKLTYIAGNPDWAATGGTVCARGGAAVSQLYDPERVKKPLIRSGERGEGKWKEVSWDEAYAYIAEKMQDIKNKYGAESMAFAARGGTHKAYMDTLAKAYGSPNTFTHESTCPIARTVAKEATFGTGALSLDYGNAKYILSLGRSFFEGINVSQVRGVAKAMANGGKLVSVDPRFSVTAAKADEWYAIKPGTDLALVLALIHVLIRDNLYDQEFVEKYTEGFAAVRDSVAAATPAWAAQETGIAEKDIEHIAKDMAAAKPRAMIDWGWRTAFSPEEFELRRASIIVTLLLGSFEVPGGMYFDKSASLINGLAGKNVVPVLGAPKLPPYPKPSRPRVDGAQVKGQPHYMVPASDGVVQAIPEAVLTGQPYPIKGWFVLRYNPVISQSNTNRVIEALKKLDLLVVCDIYLSDTAWFADVVLPESSFLERDEGFNNAGGSTPAYTLRQQVVNPVYDTKPHWQIFKDLGERLGLGQYFPWRDIEEMRAIQLGGRQDLLKTAKEKGFVNFGLKPLFLRDKNSVAQFVAKYPEAMSKVNEQGIIDGPLVNLKTPSKKMELFSHEAEELFGRGVPVYRPVKLKEDNELYFIQGKAAIHTNAHTHDVPWLHALMPLNRLWIHPDTAKQMNLQAGDAVEVTAQSGKQPATVLISKGIRPDTVFTYFGFGRLSPGLKRAYKQGTNANMLLPTGMAPVCGAALHTAGVAIRKI
ncbi:thiosulfate reductase PhsA [Sporomusa acidovorans]|uniref:Polysulfide reductase chain A n=1 Tax=Sporomusa acidovorans (strain ATCC 49682 / DSM 3132 / Mol) TaxID=1123286 RepID=A0ABZ3J693_SPOA4|nr:thiosulfate reductase PhsA [Sporomusa acidovorans]OZC24265.1 polysulfide reductase chain A precursor [Sporomusa acidovorans DSM 3132]SDF03615.1 thiosulfate reductase / polysulfide reductase chain A [Sporomusa acidovorans]